MFSVNRSGNLLCIFINVVLDAISIVCIKSDENNNYYDIAGNDGAYYDDADDNNFQSSSHMLLKSVQMHIVLTGNLNLTI